MNLFLHKLPIAQWNLIAFVNWNVTSKFCEVEGNFVGLIECWSLNGNKI